MVNVFALALGALPLAFAQYYPSVATSSVASVASNKPSGTNSTLSASATGTNTGSKSRQTVQVGPNSQLVFSPDTINAAPGSDVTFVFNAKNHSIVSADFNNPCNPAASNPIFAGFNFFTLNGTAQKTFTITVKDDKPIWLYCPQLNPKPHCPQGMVAVINPPKSGPNNLDAFRTAAAGKSTSTTPQGGVSGGTVQSGVPGGNDASGTSTGGPAQQTFSGASELLAKGGVAGGLFGFFVAFLL